MTVRRAEGEIDELRAAMLDANRKIETLHATLSARNSDLAGMEQRANVAERRVVETEAAIQRIVKAIRTELPVADDSLRHVNGAR